MSVSSLFVKKLRLTDATLHSIYQLASTLNKGDPVRIGDGAFTGCQGIFEATSGKERVNLLLKFAGQSARVQTDSNNLEQVICTGYFLTRWWVEFYPLT